MLRAMRARQDVDGVTLVRLAEYWRPYVG